MQSHVESYRLLNPSCFAPRCVVFFFDCHSCVVVPVCLNIICFVYVVVCNVCNVLYDYLSMLYVCMYICMYIYVCMFNLGEHICRPSLLCDPVFDKIDNK